MEIPALIHYVSKHEVDVGGEGPMFSYVCHTKLESEHIPVVQPC